MPFVGSGLGEDLDATVAQLVVLGRERILIDANLADRRLGRNLPAGESIDVDLPAIGADRRTGERLQIRGEIVRVIGQRVEILALQHDLARIAVVGNVETARARALLGYV